MILCDFCMKKREYYRGEVNIDNYCLMLRTDPNDFTELHRLQICSQCRDQLIRKVLGVVHEFQKEALVNAAAQRILNMTEVHHDAAMR